MIFSVHRYKINMNKKTIPQKQLTKIDNNKNETNFLRADFSKIDFKVTLPSANTLHKTSGFPIKDPITGNIIFVLEKIIYFELIYGVNLKIKADESEKWNNLKNELNTLNKDQKTKFLEAFSKMAATTKGDYLHQDIQKIIKNVTSNKKTGKIRQSGHFRDQILTNSKIKDASP